MLFPCSGETLKCRTSGFIDRDSMNSCPLPGIEAEISILLGFSTAHEENRKKGNDLLHALVGTKQISASWIGSRLERSSGGRAEARNLLFPQASQNLPLMQSASGGCMDGLALLLP